jgi:hypothetical protein
MTLTLEYVSGKSWEKKTRRSKKKGMKNAMDFS